MKDLSVSKRENSNDGFKLFWKSSKYAKLSEKKGRPNLCEDFMGVASELHLMSESIAACQMFSGHRCLKKKDAPCKKWQISVESFERGELKRPNWSKNDAIVNYVMRDRDFLHLRKSKTFISREEILSKRNSDESERLERYASGSGMSREYPGKNSNVGIPDHRQADSRRLMELMEKELKTLAKLTPSAISIVSNLTENLFHCQECRRCHEKISPSLPWILNRLQNLVKYVTSRRKDAYLWPNDHGHYSKSSQEEVDSSSSSRVTLIPVTSPRLVGKLEKVDPIVVSEDIPGVQLILKVKPEVRKKRFLYPAKPENQSKWVCRGKFPVVCFTEHRSAPVVEVLKSTAKPGIAWEKKLAVAPFKGYAASCRAVYLWNLRFAALVTVTLAKGKPITYERASPKIIFERLLTENEQNIGTASFICNLIDQSEWNIGQLLHSFPKEKLNVKEKVSKKCEESSTELVGDLLEEAEEGEMQVQRVNELEEEVKELKDLMLEVHKNQTELGKLLIEKNIFSQLMVKLADPKMLEEENKTLKKASDGKAPSTSSSTLALQMKVDSLKRKCSLKNRLIVTLLRGLRSNVPKELWEEVVAYVFDDSESMNIFDSEKINEFIRQTSLFLTSDEKERKLAPSPSRTELQSAEEEPKVKGIMGAEVEDNMKNLTRYENRESAVPKGFSPRLEGSPSKIWEVPVLNVPNSSNTALRKLENQISILNMENERLWHQVNELRELLKHSVNEMSLFQKDTKINKVKTTGKTINLVIHIAEKDSCRPRNGVYFPPSEVEIADGRVKSSPLVGIAESESITAVHEADRENSSFECDRKLALFPSSQNNYGARLKSDLHDYKQENEKLNAALREKVYPNGRTQGLLIRTPHSSAHEMFQNFKPAVWVPSKHVIPEVSDLYGAGPSRKHPEMTNLLQKPSLMELAEIQPEGMHATMSNERELQTIPENDSDLSSGTSGGVTQVIQRLRTRVRSLHKDMTVLRSKNDRIDKLLDRLMDDIVENNHNYEKLESSLSSLRSRFE